MTDPSRPEKKEEKKGFLHQAYFPAVATGLKNTLAHILRRQPNFTAIDVSDVAVNAGGMQHDYFISEPAVLRDMIQVLVLGNRKPGSAGRLMRRNT